MIDFGIVNSEWDCVIYVFDPSIHLSISSKNSFSKSFVLKQQNSHPTHLFVSVLIFVVDPVEG